MRELKDNIINTSLKLFETHGFHGVTVKQIVEESGTSKGGFYHHFKSKDELLYVIHDTFISYVLVKATEAQKAYTAPAEKLQAIIRSFVKVFDLYKSHITVFYRESVYLKPDYYEKIKEKRDQFKQEIFRVLEEGIQAGEFRSELPVEIAGMSILGIVNWTYMWYQKNGSKSIDEIADIFTDFILHAVLVDEAKQKDAYAPFFLRETQFF